MADRRALDGIAESDRTGDVVEADRRAIGAPR
jgi:hypothetical protein